MLQEGDMREADIPWEARLPPASLWSGRRGCSLSREREEAWWLEGRQEAGNPWRMTEIP